MPNIEEIDSQIAALPHRYVFWTQKEIRALPEILDADESILALTSGLMNGATWLAVCTEKRVMFINRGMIFGLRQVQIPLDRVQSIDHDYAILFGTIRVWDGASYFTLKLVLKSSIDPFVRTTQEAINNYKLSFQQKVVAKAAAPSSDIASQLERLAALKEKGVLTEEEFALQKKKLLSQ